MSDIYIYISFYCYQQKLTLGIRRYTYWHVVQMGLNLQKTENKTITLVKCVAGNKEH